MAADYMLITSLPRPGSNGFEEHPGARNKLKKVEQEENPFTGRMELLNEPMQGRICSQVGRGCGEAKKENEGSSVTECYSPIWLRIQQLWSTLNIILTGGNFLFFYFCFICYTNLSPG